MASVTDVVLIGFQKAAADLRNYLVDQRQKLIELELKAAEQTNLITIEKSEDVLWWEQKLREKQLFAENLESQVKNRDDQLKELLLRNELKLNFAKEDVKAKEEEVTNFQKFVAQLG